MSYALQVYASPGGPLLADWTQRAQNPQVSFNEHGYLTLTASIPLTRDDAFWWYDRAGLPQVELNSRWGTTEWCGRLEEVTITDTGIDITAYGPWQALRDIPYTALWSDTKLDRWRILTIVDNAAFMSDRFEFTMQDQLRIAPRKGEVFGTGTFPLGIVGYEPPDGGSRQIAGVSFDYELVAPANWVALLQRATSNWTGQQNLWTLTSAGTPQIGTANPSFSGTSDRLSFSLFYNAADATYAGETGTTVRLVISNVRVITSTTYALSTTLGTAVTLQVNTTLGTAIAAGTRTVTPASMTNIVVGLRLTIGGTSEVVTVTATTGTTFTAVFANAHSAANTVQGIGSVTVTPASMTGIYVGQRLGIGSGAGGETVVVTAMTTTTFTAIYTLTHAAPDAVTSSLIYADRIAVDTVLKVVALNADQLNSSTGLIQSPGIDLQQRIFEDVEAASILTDLAKLGDNQSPPNQWEIGVGDPSRALYFRPRGSAGRTWYVDDGTLEITRTLDELATGAYAVYQSKTNRNLRTPVVDDAYSTSRYALTRRRAVTTQTTDLTEATTQRTVYLTDHVDPIPRAKLQLKQVFDAGGLLWPLRSVRAGDTIVLRRLSPVAGEGIDRIRSFCLQEVRLTTTGIEVTPETPVDQLETHVLQLAERVNA